jgi:hypothetical protein
MKTTAKPLHTNWTQLEAKAKNGRIIKRAVNLPIQAVKGKESKILKEIIKNEQQ